MKLFKSVMCGLFAALLCQFAVAAPTPSFQLSDLQKLVSLSDPQISPDGKQIAMILSTPDWKTNKNKQEIDLVDTASGTRRALTWNREDLSSPRWSPDGTRLAFLSKDAETKKPQIFVMPMDGGDAQRITDNKQGVLEFSWSPDGSEIAFIAQEPPINEKAIKEHNDVFQVTDGNFQLRAAVAPWHLWLVASSGGEAKRLTQGDFSLQTDQEGATPLIWSHDGKRIIFTQFPNPYWGPSFRSVIAEVGVKGGEPRTLVSAQGATAFAYSPDGDTYAFMRPRNGDQNNGDAVYVDLGGTTRDATQALARNFNFYAWLPDGKSLLLAGDYGTHASLWEQPLEGRARLLDLGAVHANPEASVSKTG
ncbi:MAG: PD40 domain-containing protein, partial [Gammaproteobacteria bacterium]|nr:PD40 domain-containing protein [Gammaproteobacteria bacterium]